MIAEYHRLYVVRKRHSDAHTTGGKSPTGVLFRMVYAWMGTTSILFLVEGSFTDRSFVAVYGAMIGLPLVVIYLVGSDSFFSLVMLTFEGDHAQMDGAFMAELLHTST